jgi:hypothetical protein
MIVKTVRFCHITQGGKLDLVTSFTPALSAMVYNIFFFVYYKSIKREVKKLYFLVLS